MVRIDATPVNPSDVGLLFAGADMSAANVPSMMNITPTDHFDVKPREPQQ